MTERTYVIVSPVRNEEDFAALTLDSVLAQSVLPAQWVIVDDGSTDRTAEIVATYAARVPWIKLVKRPDRGFYYPGPGVVEVFNFGLASIDCKNWKFLVKLDMDLSFGESYFLELLNRFESKGRLGIASGFTVTKVNGRWIPDRVRPDHPIGATKMYRRECFESSGGLLPVPGWDLADTLSAQMRGWTTEVFYELQLQHYRVTGSRRGANWSRSILQGRFEYGQGYFFLFTLLKALRNSLDTPAVVGSVGRVVGYLWAWLCRDDFLFPKDMRDYLREKQKKALLSFGRSR